MKVEAKKRKGPVADGLYRAGRAHAFSKQGYFVKFDAIRIGEKKPPKPNFVIKLTKQGQPEQAGMTDAEGFVRLDLPAAGRWRLFFPDVDGAGPQGS